MSDQIQSTTPCLGCQEHRLFMCVHVDITTRQQRNCGYCRDCCPDRKAIIDNLPYDDQENARRALVLMPAESFINHGK